MRGLIQGTAPQARLLMQALLGYSQNAQKEVIFGESKKTIKDLLTEAYGLYSRIHSNSWGQSWKLDEEGNPIQKTQHPYGSDRGSASQIDDFIWNNKEMVVCLAAGNDGRYPTQKAHVGAQARAKNCITIGACVSKRPCARDNDYDGERYDPTSKMIGSPERIAAFSSTGPTGEDRIKPDVVAPGTMILSACSSKIHMLDEKAGASKDKG